MERQSQSNNIINSLGDHMQGFLIKISLQVHVEYSWQQFKSPRIIPSGLSPSEIKTATTQKIIAVYDKEVSNSTQNPVAHEREYYVQSIMEEKQVSCDVAEAEVDFPP